jgi:hypothetical protein
VVVMWEPGRPLGCAEHGQLAPVAGDDAPLVLLEHLRDAHGANVALALASLAARRAGKAR